MTYMYTPQEKNSCTKGHEIYNFGRDKTEACFMSDQLECLKTKFFINSNEWFLELKNSHPMKIAPQNSWETWNRALLFTYRIRDTIFGRFFNGGQNWCVLEWILH